MGPLTKTLVGALIPVGVGVGIGVTAAGALGYGAIKATHRFAASFIRLTKSFRRCSK